MDESWPEPPINQNDHEPCAHAKNLLKTTKQWKKSAGEGGLPSLERFVLFLDAVSSLATRIKESDTLAELQRISKVMIDNDRKHTDMIVNIQQSINLQAAKATTAAAGQALPGRAKPSSYREALASHVTSSQSSLVSEWLTRAKMNGTVPSNDLSSGSSAATEPSLLMREDLQLLVRGTARTLVDPLRRDEAELVRRINKAIKADVRDLELPDERGPVSSGRVLPSGDVLLQVDSLDQVRQLTQAAAQKDSNWCHVFGENAALKRHAYAVLAREVSCRFNPYQPGGPSEDHRRKHSSPHQRHHQHNAHRMADEQATDGGSAAGIRQARGRVCGRRCGQPGIAIYQLPLNQSISPHFSSFFPHLKKI
ncbi:hypothetical protein N7494_005388 [Penicillium frequentans]|uniref:Uncharacterized protein n=1 Tax=Penicillium frequentans TaxID=3151616 RepID=A0AAD6D073_9EURO|nr:hypothetical protein N7494_005388 [Penicillium glabrum]